MSNVYKLIELVGVSEKSYEEAIQNAIKKASKSLKAISWFQVIEQRGAVKDGNVTEFQVILKVGFKLVD
ncbi:MAG TPA: dodecin domain-containing protein [Caldithrix abyssi]|uniref:Dodecin domain-containing protein n=1 Tax=Caldithrix abyssi TaxID=187145 RepID=A0A7V4WW03_CALAY|nr:dodecin domain-containing protein [Caldithrix abyssi]